MAPPFLKVKLDGDVAVGAKTLAALLESRSSEAAPQAAVAEAQRCWSIDANAGWTPSIAQVCVDTVLKHEPLRSLLLMVEQPFPADIGMGQPPAAIAGKAVSGGDDPYDVAAWLRVKAAYNKVGLLFYGDESVATVDDVNRLHKAGLVDGVNIKMEKAGGLRQAMRAAQAARDAGLKMWLGVMVGSVLNSNAIAHLLPMAEHCDVDGALLVQDCDNRFAGGFQWVTADTSRRAAAERHHLNASDPDLFPHHHQLYGGRWGHVLLPHWASGGAQGPCGLGLHLK
jgi:L-alanine-DL-glutamate epimerase-like enolase superfamily enzyme